MEEKEFFVGIYDPTDVRRSVLESSKEIIDSIQSNKKLKQIREDKLLLYGEMQNIMHDLDLLISKLNNKLPETHLRKTVIKNDVHPKIQKLEKELRSIETDFNKL